MLLGTVSREVENQLASVSRYAYCRFAVFTPSTPTRSRAWVDVDLAALRRNALRLRATSRSGRLIPMVKANGYGLGLAAVAHTLIETLGVGLHAFGVATVAEGVELRGLGWPGRIIVFSPTPPGEYRPAAEYDLTLTHSSLEAVRDWAAAGRDVGRVVEFHVEVDTGMGRAGFRDAARPSWSTEVERAGGASARWRGCFTHFHSADEADTEPTEAQWRRFQRVVRGIEAQRKDSEPLVYHASNSAASVRLPAFAGHAVRPGIFLYGGWVGGGIVPEPVASVRARISLVSSAAADATVGYGAEYRAVAPERWGTLAIGYGDGIPRSLWPGRGRALVRGRSVPIIGRISMDTATVDLTAVPEARAGDVTTLLGRDGEAEITLGEVAERCGTISYEILTGLGARLPRNHVLDDTNVDSFR